MPKGTSTLQQADIPHWGQVPMRDLRLFPKIERPGVVELILVAQVLVLWPLFNHLPSWSRLAGN